MGEQNYIPSIYVIKRALTNQNKILVHNLKCWYGFSIGFMRIVGGRLMRRAGIQTELSQPPDITVYNEIESKKILSIFYTKQCVFPCLLLFQLSDLFCSQTNFSLRKDQTKNMQLFETQLGSALGLVVNGLCGLCECALQQGCDVRLSSALERKESALY